MRLKRISKAVALGAVAAMAMSACSANTGTTTSSSAAAGGGEVRVVEVNGFSSFNSSTADGNSDINAKIAYATGSNFNYIDNGLNIVKNEKFGTYEVLSENPLKVKYTINPGVTWSDGTQIDADDMLFWWAIESAHFNDVSKTDPETGEPTEGNAYFDYAGTTEGLALTSLPEVSEDNQSITLSYSKPYADWEIAFAALTPAHIAAEKGGMTPEELTQLIKETPKGDPENPGKENAKLRAVADFWNSGYESTSLPADKDLYLSSGPFIVSDVVADQSITLVRNDSYNWGPAANVDSIVVRTIGDSAAQVAALKNGEVDIIAPQASSDTVKQLEALGSSVVVQRGEQLAYDHLDLNHSGVFKDAAVREAFMKTVPRDQIVDSVIGDLDPEAKPLDSQLFVPANEGYAASAASNGSANYAKADIAGAKELLDGDTPTVRIMYNKDNPNRVDAYSLIAESAGQAGFKVVDGGLGATEWSAALGSGNYDASIFGWTSPGVGVNGVPQLFGSDSASNFSGFNSPEADALMDELIVTTDRAKQTELQTKIDKLIFDDHYGLPLFQSVGVEAHSAKIGGVEYMPNQTGVWWNFWEWTVNS